MPKRPKQSEPAVCRVTSPAVCGRPVHSRGFCSRHEIADRRGVLGKTREIAKPGEGDSVTFRCPKPKTDAVAAIARRERVDESVLYREAVDMLLADRARKTTRRAS